MLGGAIDEKFLKQPNKIQFCKASPAISVELLSYAFKYSVHVKF